MTWFASIRMLLRHFPRKVGLARSGTALRFRCQGRLPSSCFGMSSLTLSQLGARARGVVVIDKLVTAAELDDMATVGVRGVRLNLETAEDTNAVAAKLTLNTIARTTARSRLAHSVRHPPVRWRHFARQLVAANAHRVLWGSNWPHPGRGPTPRAIAPPYPNDDGRVLNLLPTWEPDLAIGKKILVDNPARLYGFEMAAAVRPNV